MIKKLKALLQWFVQLELEGHRHWCYIRNPDECENSHICWHCTGIFCANLDRKDCKKCEKSKKQRLVPGSTIVKIL